MACILLLKDLILRQTQYNKLAVHNQMHQEPLRNSILHQVLPLYSNAFLFNKIFLSPFEVMLKHSPSQQEGHPAVQNTLNPQGLLLAHKMNGIQDNAYQQKEFKALSTPIKNETELKKESLDNMISYLKPENQSTSPIKLAICICMYSQDKKMLKETISGVKKDILNLLLKQGMDVDSIAVFVIIDGIMSIDPSILEYISQLQQQSFISINKYNYQKDKEDVDRQEKQKNQGAYVQQNYVKNNLNNFLFSSKQFSQFQEKRLPKVYSEYKDLLIIQNQLHKLKTNSDNKNVYDKLPQRIKDDFFPSAAKKYYEQYYGKIDAENKQEILTELKLDTSDGIAVTNNTIESALKHIQKYINSRDKLTYVAPFRLPYEEDNVEMCFEQQQSTQEALRQRPKTFNKLHMNLFICTKYKNSGKLSSHNWFFNGFCKELNPKYTILMDVGLVPKPMAIVKMIKTMQKDKTIGGVCGYMCLREQNNTGEQQQNQIKSFTNYAKCFADIQKSQTLQYHLAHILDKAFESACGFIHVLPGAFSGYNMQALRSKGRDSDRLFSEYFKSIQDKIIESQIKTTNLTVIQIILRIFMPSLIYNLCFEVEKESQQELLYNQNIFFAEDRILCMLIYKNGYRLAYIPDAISDVDPVKSVHRLMGQRKRWINGSMFAYQKVRKEIYAMKGCHFLLRTQVYFYDFVNVLIYFSPSIFFFTINISVISFNQRIIRPLLNLQLTSEDNNTIQTTLSTISSACNYTYAIILLSMIFYSLNLTALNPYFKISIYMQSAILGTIALIIIIIYIIDTGSILTGDGFFFIDSIDISQAAKDIIPIHRILILLIFLCYIFSVLVYSLCFKTFKVICDAVKSTLSFIFYTPTYFIILSFYALCRMDDISWGTKGLDHSDTKQVKLKTKWTLIKLIHVFRYIIWNGAASITLFILSKKNQQRLYISFSIACCILFIIGVKTIFGSLYMLAFKVSSIFQQKIERNRRVIVRVSRLMLIRTILLIKQEQICTRVRNFTNILNQDHNFNDALMNIE